jgi:hypothetical protein
VASEPNIGRGSSSLKLTANMLFQRLKQVAGEVKASSEKQCLIAMSKYMSPVFALYYMHAMKV